MLLNRNGSARTNAFTYTVNAVGNRTQMVDSSLGGKVQWSSQAGSSTQTRFVGDFNGDGKKDLGVWDPTNGRLSVALSTGSSLGPLTQWTSADGGAGWGNEEKYVGDFTGDGKADVGIYVPSNGQFWVAPSATGTTYSYDGLYRLTAATYPNGDVQSYTYDPMGNRLAKVQNGVTTTYTYDNAGQMTAAGAAAYTYDNDGNTTAGGANAYAWDAANRLAGTTIGGVTSSYGYNGAGLRTSRTIGGAALSYAWDLTGSMPNVLQDSAGNKYVYGLGLISATNGTNQQYFLSDGLGSTTAITDRAGNVTGTYTYDAFGAVRSQSGTTTERSYTGEQNDPTGLEYLRARYYDASTCRFLSQDPLPQGTRT